MRLINTLLLYTLYSSGYASALPKISRAGRYLFGEDGNRFYIKVSSPSTASKSSKVHCLFPGPFLSGTRRHYKHRPVRTASHYFCDINLTLTNSYSRCFILYNHRSTAFPEPSDYIDPLADASGCARDIPYMKQLGLNTIRVYSVNASENHDNCMSALSAAGIYTMCVSLSPLLSRIHQCSNSVTCNVQYLPNSIYFCVCSGCNQLKY